jgi:hypothetical protein
MVSFVDVSYLSSKLYLMKKRYFLPFIMSMGIATGQVGVGTTAPNGALEVASATDGLLIPRIALVNTSTATVATPTTSELVYNTATSADVTPGFYYWSGSAWIRLNTVAGNHWNLTGNSGTAAGTNYIGTTDAQNLQLRTAAAERMTISGTTGNIAVGTPALPATTKFEVSSGIMDGIFGHSTNVGGYLGRETNITFGSPAQNILGAGVYANNPTAGYTSAFSQSTGSATVAANICYSDVWMASYNYVQNNSATANPMANYNQLNVTSAALGGDQIALRGYSSRGTTAGNPGYTIGVDGVADSQNQDSFGVEGLAFSNSSTRAGGYFESLSYAGASQAFAYVGTTVGGIARKITGTNAVSEIIPTPNHGRITMTAPECPEYWYQDYGTVDLVNGKATIVLDEILADIVVVDEENPIRVICTPVGMPYFNGVTIMAQSKNAVELLELNGGAHSGKLQYQLTLRPKTGYGEGRFPQAPGPAYVKADREPLAAKAKNQPKGRDIFYWPSDHEAYQYNPEDFVAIGSIIPAGPNIGKIKLGNGKYGEASTAQRPERK